MTPTALERGSGITLWRQVEARLADEIRALASETRLPAETELATRFGVNRHTVRQAVRALADRGLVRVEQGRGAFVREPIAYPIGPGTRFTANLLAVDRLARRRILEIRPVAADAEFAERLELAVGAALLLVRSVGEADGVAVALSHHWLPAERLPGARERLLGDPSLTALYRSSGHDHYRRGPTRISARASTDEEARLLATAPGSPVLTTSSCDIAAAGVPLGVGHGVWAAERVQLLVPG